MAEDGYGSFSGGGSVLWEVHTAEGEMPAMEEKYGATRGYLARGIDKKCKDNEQQYFLVRVPDIKSVRIAIIDGELCLSLPIKDKNERPQIRVSWAWDPHELPDGLRAIPNALFPERDRRDDIRKA